MANKLNRTSLIFAAILLVATVKAQSVIDGGLQHFNTQQKIKAKAVKSTRHTTRLLPARLPLGTEQVIWETPEGTLYANQAYSNTYHHYNQEGEVESARSEAILINYVLQPDSTIWLKSPISLTETGWVRLDKQGDGIYVAHTPQLVLEDLEDFDDDGNPYRAYATRLVLRNDGDGYYYYPDTTSEGTYNLDIRFSYKDGVLRQLEDSCVADMNNMPYEVLGLTYNTGAWLGVATADMKIYPILEQATILPEGAELKQYILTDSTLNAKTGRFGIVKQLVHMALYGNEAYIATPEGTGAWIRGTRKGDGSLTFQPQYLGPCASLGTHIWFRPVTYGVAHNEEDSQEETYALTFYETNELRLTPNGNDSYFSVGRAAMVINASPSKILYVSSYLTPSVTLFQEVAAKPATPKFYEYYPYNEEWEYGLFTVNIPVYDVEGNLIDPVKLSYVVYLDEANEPYTFSPSLYAGLEKELTEVPYFFTDKNRDFSITERGHTIYLFVNNYNRVGIQSIYHGAGQEHRSDIVWTDGTVTAGIITTNMQQTQPTVHYDIQGRRLQKAVRGLNIVRMTNGTVRKSYIR